MDDNKKKTIKKPVNLFVLIIPNRRPQTRPKFEVLAKKKKPENKKS